MFVRDLFSIMDRGHVIEMVCHDKKTKKKWPSWLIFNFATIVLFPQFNKLLEDVSATIEKVTNDPKFQTPAVQTPQMSQQQTPTGQKKASAKFIDTEVDTKQDDKILYMMKFDILRIVADHEHFVQVGVGFFVLRQAEMFNRNKKKKKFFYPT